MRYRAAAGVGEEAHSRQPHWCPWSKPVNVEKWGHVSGPIVMAHALAELRCGIVARQHENGFKSGRNLGHTLYARTHLPFTACPSVIYFTKLPAFLADGGSADAVVGGV